MSKRTRPRHSSRPRLERAAMHSNELGEPARKPKSLQPAAPFYLAVDRQLKSGYDTYEDAEKAALAVKGQHPRLLVTVYETRTRGHIVIEPPKPVARFNAKRSVPVARDTVAGSATMH